MCTRTDPPKLTGLDHIIMTLVYTHYAESFMVIRSFHNCRDFNGGTF